MAFKILSLSELREEAKKDPPAYIVEGLFAVGSINMLAGRPKAGKSGLTRQLAVAVAKGEDFLGRATTQGEVLYLGLDEPILAFVAEHFDLLGAEEGTSHCVIGSIDKRAAGEYLKAALDTYPNVRLIIIDTLLKFLSVEDTDKYTEMNDALEFLTNIAAERKVTFILTHHTNKRGGESVVDSVLGSTAITGAVATIMAMYGEGSELRIIRTTQRYGVSLDKTTLPFRPDTKTFELGEPVATIEEQEAASSRRDKSKAIMEVVLAYPQGVESGTLKKQVVGNATALALKLKSMVDSGILRVQGTGKRGDPLVYFAPDAIPTQSTEPIHTRSTHIESAA